MIRIKIISASLAIALTLTTAVAINASATPPPQWAGKGVTAGKTVCKLWFWLAYGWPTLPECENGGIPTLGIDYFGRFLDFTSTSKTSQKLSSTSQSVECNEENGSGGLNNITTTMQGIGVVELALSGCKVWKGKFESELKECHATSIENGGEAGEAGKIRLLVDSELVYLNSEGTKIGELLQPSRNEGTRFALLDFTGTGCVDSGQQVVTGDALAEVTPQNTEVETENVLLPATALSKCWQWTLPATLKECATVGLKAFGVALTESGEDPIKLSSKEKFDVLD